MRNRLDVSAFVGRHQEVGVLAAFLTFVLIFYLISPKFLTLDSITSMFTVAAHLGIIALGVSMLMISGEFDISVGSVLFLSAFIFSTLGNAGLFAPIAFIATLGVCALIGLLNGLITLRLGIPSFITTLGMMMFWSGIAMIITSGSMVMWKGSKNFLQVMGANPFAMFRLIGVWFVGLMILFFIIVHKTRYGNWVFATGGNVEVARNRGVKVQRVKLINFIVCSVLTGIAGVGQIALYSHARSDVGEGKELEAIAACVIGGNLLTGGRGSILGTFIGVLFMSILRTGLIMVGMTSYMYIPVTGIIVIIAVVINTLISRRIIH